MKTIGASPRKKNKKEFRKQFKIKKTGHPTHRDNVSFMNSTGLISKLRKKERKLNYVHTDINALASQRQL
jgi:hypothetical protein